ncbi:hypothetical protein RSOLAG22IIIB_12813 [Rhizoctonia solani]|uniref:Uncharacterized protein n=1 Tax=Rhizoctonia solani TaxID=456999 RepID=A0A0K6GH09_9AGAM|nr:hypothetical protein RSOLAG22IIIB_12813 [Rhizoctonia solani]
MYRPESVTIAICARLTLAHIATVWLNQTLVPAPIISFGGISVTCTSVVIKVAYHQYSSFSADIEFITREAWRDEIENASGDIGDAEQGQISSDLRELLDASWNKVHAVYPNLIRKEMVKVNPEALIRSHSHTARLLGTTISIEYEMATGLRRALEPFIKASSSIHRQTGYLLVNLPGVGDANVARNQVAKNYMKNADHVWVVVSIERAVDEGVDKELIDKTFERELRYGKYNAGAIAFIVSKTDNIYEDEAAESLGLKNHPTFVQLQGELDQVESSQDASKDKQHGSRKLERERARLEEAKKCFVSLKRNEFVKSILAEPFRKRLIGFDSGSGSCLQDACTIGMKILGKTNIERGLMIIKDDYSSTLQIYACSALDYKAVDNEYARAKCFSNVDDTEIPRLQDSCIRLGLQAQTAPVQHMFNTLNSLLGLLQSSAENVESENVLDRLTLASQWESGTAARGKGALFPRMGLPTTRSGRYFHHPDLSKPPSAEFKLGIIAQRVLRAHHQQPRGTRKGFAYQACQEMEKVVHNCVDHLRHKLWGGLVADLRRGAAVAVSNAMRTHDCFAPPLVSWSTYRATLRRYGEFKEDMNGELVAPIIDQVLEVWQQIFGRPLLDIMNQDARRVIYTLLSRVEQSCPLRLQSRCTIHCALAREQAETAIELNLKGFIVCEQRELARFLAPKNTFRGDLETLRHVIFTEAVNELLEKLDSVASSIGVILSAALEAICYEIELVLSALWEVPELNKDEVTARRELALPPS